MKRNDRECQYLGSGVFRKKKQKEQDPKLVMSWECTPTATNTGVCGRASLEHGHQGADRQALWARGRKMLSRRETQLDFHCRRWFCVEQNHKGGRTRARPGIRMKPQSR